MTELNYVLELTVASSVPVSVCDGQNRIVDCNNAFNAMVGLAKDEVIGEKPSEFLLGEKTSTSELDRARERLKDGTPFDMTIEAYRKSGESFFLSVFFIPFVDGKDSIPYVVGISREKAEFDSPLFANADPEFKKMISEVLSVVQSS